MTVVTEEAKQAGLGLVANTAQGDDGRSNSCHSNELKSHRIFS